MLEILIYSTKTCPNCKILKQLLDRENIPYKEINMATPETMTNLRMMGVNAMSAPILQIGNIFYTTNELCIGNDIDQNIVKNIIDSYY